MTVSSCLSFWPWVVKGWRCLDWMVIGWPKGIRGLIGNGRSRAYTINLSCSGPWSRLSPCPPGAISPVQHARIVRKYSAHRRKTDEMYSFHYRPLRALTLPGTRPHTVARLYWSNSRCANLTAQRLRSARTEETHT